MFEKIIIFSVIVIAAILQISFFPNVFPSGSAPEAVLLIIIFWVAQSGYERNWGKAVFAGFILDIFYFWPVGVNIIAISAVAFGIGSLTKRFQISNKNLGFFVMLAIVIVGTLANSVTLDFIAVAANRLAHIRLDYLISDSWSSKMIMKTLANLALFTLLYWPLLTLAKFMSFYDRKSMQGRFFK
jgi:rod shape-determining protein MreD